MTTARLTYLSAMFEDSVKGVRGASAREIAILGESTGLVVVTFIAEGWPLVFLG